jgi:hypothetical protein
MGYRNVGWGRYCYSVTWTLVALIIDLTMIFTMELALQNDQWKQKPVNWKEIA